MSRLTFCLFALLLAFTACNQDITRTDRGVEAPAGRDAQDQQDHRRVPVPGHPDNGTRETPQPEPAPGGY
ncbi:MAG: hypothetical protein ACK4ND_09855 [Cytophagaceae bacterium]